VSRVGERARVAAVVDVQRDVPVHAEERDLEHHARERGRDRHPAGQPGDALGGAGERGEARRAPGAVARDEEPEACERDRRGARGDRDLVERGPTGGVGGCEISYHRVMLHGLMSHQTRYDRLVSDVTHAAASGELTIDELARRVGMTVRNVRAHQSRGLLPAPEVRGRTGFYGAEHVARLELIRTLQDDGFNLESIRRLLERTGGSSEELLRFTRAAREPFADEAPEVIGIRELGQRFGAEGRADLLERAVALGLLRPLGDGRFADLSPRLGRAGEELTSLGVEPEEALAAVERLREHADAVSQLFVELFLTHVWRPFDAAGRPAERWPEVREALERLRPLAGDALTAVFGLAMGDAVERAFGAVLGEPAGDD
jgi:DNA-binding transcriptional MerR regulator